MATARLSHLSYWYPQAATPALADVTLDIFAGLTVVAGPSGGGKSTLLRVLNGLVPHFHGGRIKGTALIQGRDVVQTPTRQLATTVGFVFQDPELQAVYDSVEREVAFGLENLALPRSTMRERVDHALTEVGIEHLRTRKLGTLSGGERQRVALASVLAMEPRVIALDEPTSQLDPDGAARVLGAARDLAGGGRAIVISEHRLDRLQTIANAVVTVNGGQVERHAPEAWRAIRPLTEAVERNATPGEEAWSLTKVTAGHAGHPVVSAVDLAGRGGEVVALSGPNGAGKTTLLRTIAGSLPPLSGRVERRPRRIAYLPQNPTALLHRPTVRAEVDLTLEWAKETDDPTRILDALGLMSVAQRYARDLSSGERQRAALAAILAGRPGLVLLDEPTRGMDTFARGALVRLVTAMRDAGAAMVLATHDAELQRVLADRVVEICNGRVNESQAVAT